MSLRMIETNPVARRGVIAGLVIVNTALVPLYASMVAVMLPSWNFAQTHHFGLAGLPLLAVVILLRWRLIVGLIANLGLLLLAAVTLVWSPEPTSYLALASFLLFIGICTYGLILYFSHRRLRRQGP